MLAVLKHGQMASRRLHDDLLVCCGACFVLESLLTTRCQDRCVHARVAFYDTTPTGRILTRFSKDFRDIDAMLSSLFETYCRELYRGLVLFGLVIYGSVYLIAAVVILSLLFWVYMRFYRRTSVRLQRLGGECSLHGKKWRLSIARSHIVVAYFSASGCVASRAEHHPRVLHDERRR